MDATRPRYHVLYQSSEEDREGTAARAVSSQLQQAAEGRGKRKEILRSLQVWNIAFPTAADDDVCVGNESWTDSPS